MGSVFTKLAEMEELEAIAESADDEPEHVESNVNQAIAAEVKNLQSQAAQFAKRQPRARRGPALHTPTACRDATCATCPPTASPSQEEWVDVPHGEQAPLTPRNRSRGGVWSPTSGTLGAPKAESEKVPKSDSAPLLQPSASSPKVSTTTTSTTPALAVDATEAQLVPDQLHNFWGVECTEELNVMPEEEPEYIDVEMTLDTGATVHSADRLDFPGCNVLESPGSKAGQHFQSACKKLIANEGQADIEMVAPEGVDMALTVQIAKISRPLLSVTKMTESGNLEVVCRKDEARVLDMKGRTVARFPRKGGLYVCVMKYRNPKFRPESFPRPHE